MAASVYMKFGRRGKGSICFPRKQKIEISRGHQKSLLLVPICRVSPSSSATVVAVLLDEEIRNGTDRRRPRAPVPSALGEGDPVRRARHIRLLSGYLLA